MRIQDVNRIGALQSYQKMGQKSLEKNIQRTHQKDQVEISSQGQERLKQVRGEQPTREERISQLKQQLSTGTYQVDSSQIAEKILSYWKK